MLPSETCIFGLQRIPFVVFAHRTGRSVCISGIRRQTYVAAIPASRSLVVSDLVGRLLAVRSVPVSHFINIELSPSNSVVNPARIYALFGAGATLPAETEFFTEWDEASSEMLLRLDAELQSGRRRIPRDTSFVAPILLQYDANDANTLMLRFRSLATLSGRRVPVRTFGDQRLLAAQSPYVVEDIDHGLASVRAILRLAGAPTPLMDEILSWRTMLEPSGGDEDDLPGATPLATFDDIEALMTMLDSPLRRRLRALSEKRLRGVEQPPWA